MPASGPLSWFFSSQTAVNSRNVVRSIRRSNALSAALPLRGRFDARSVASLQRPAVQRVSSFRDGPKDQARNLEIPGSRFARPGMTTGVKLNQPAAVGDAAQVIIGIAKGVLDHGEPLEVVADLGFHGHADAAMQLDRLLADEF